MATTTTTTRLVPAPSPILSVFTRIISALARSQEQARIRNELSQMSARELADLGLMTSDINDVAAGTYRRG
jgi:uncharacterized protein YjiS (DUF1127 family)